MSEERVKILSMLNEGKISAADAEQLVRVINLQLASEPEPALPSRRGKQVTSRTYASEFSTDQIVQLAMHGIDADHVRELREAGLDDLTVDQIVELSVHGVDVDRIRELREAGLGDLTIDQIIELSVHGVDSDHIAAIL